MGLILGTMQIGGKVSKVESFEIQNHDFSNEYFKFNVTPIYKKPFSKEKFNLSGEILSEWINYLSNNILQNNVALESVEKSKLPNQIYDEVYKMLSDYSISAW